jgi:ribosome-associated toxin RatA of RatAB toxin-antitoxin module
MRRIQVTDCRTLAFPPTQVFAAVADLENYPRWWPAELKVRVLKLTPNEVGSRLEVHPHRSLLVCEVTRIVVNSEIHIRYVQGVQRGTGVWTFEPSDGGTRLCYRVDLESQGWIPGLLSHFVDFTAMHSRLMEKVFDGLEKWLLGKAS